VVGQQQGLDTLGTADISTKAAVTDSTFPFYKPYVATDQNDSRSPKLHAQMLLERMKYEGFRLEYRVAGHSQNGTNWRINEMCRVTDEVFGLDDDYLIYGRAFELTKDGAFTRLILGLPGMVQ
jgi:prophage tail gpP-like protein